MKINCTKCGVNMMPTLSDKGPHTGMHCSSCGAFIKWAKQEEINVIMESLSNELCDCDKCDCADKESDILKESLNSLGGSAIGGTLNPIFPEVFDSRPDVLVRMPKGQMPSIVQKSRKVIKKQAQWDSYFMAMCNVVATNSKCFSRQIGALIVKDNAILSSGYNGPPRGIPQCYEKLNIEQGLDRLEEPCCPRRKLGAPSGTRLDLCYAQHAERNAITQAASNGTAIKGATLYLNDSIPCKDCLGAIINAGIVEVICTELKYYDADEQGKWLLDNSNLTVREVYNAD